MNSIIHYNYAALYSDLLEPFRSEAFGPRLATILLLLAVVVLIGFWCFALPQALRLRAALAIIQAGTQKGSEQQKRATFLTDFQQIDQALRSNKVVSRAWQEFRKNLITRRDGQRTIIINSTPPQNFFNPRNLRVQYDFVRALPNFFVGLGLLGTFIGLIAALTFSTQDLTRAVDQEQIKQALKVLLTTAAAKFYISAAGLVSFLVLSFLIRLSLKHLHGLVHQISTALDERVSFLNQVAISERQLSIQQGSLEELRLFNTNVAMKVGDAVRTALEISNSSLTAKLDQIADAFAKLIDVSKEGTGSAVSEAMKGVFDATLRETSDALGSVAISLQDLPNRLALAATSIQDAGNAAAEQQKQLAQTLQLAVDEMLRNATNQMTTNLDQSTRNLVTSLGNAGASFGDNVTNIGAIFERFSSSGDDYIKSLSSLTEQTAAFKNDLSSISSHMTAAAEDLRKAGSTVNENVSKVLGGVQESVRVAEETNQSIRTSQEAIGSAVESLRNAMSMHIQRFDQVDEKLATIFSSIASHIEQQARQMAESLSTMDHALASAVNQFEQLIDNLAEVGAERRISAAEHQIPA